MILASIKFIYSSNHFDGQLMWLKISAGLVCISVFASLYQWIRYSDGRANSEIVYALTAFTAFETETLVDAHKIYKSVHRVTIIAH